MTYSPDSFNRLMNNSGRDTPKFNAGYYGKIAKTEERLFVHQTPSRA